MAFQTPETPSSATEAFGATDVGLSFMRQVFAWMFLGLVVTTGVAVYFSETADVIRYFEENGGMMLLLIGVQLAVVFGLIFAINRVPAWLASTLFLAYSALIGVTFALVLQVYTTGSVVGATAGAAGVFGGMAAFGYFTKTDLTKFGPILFGALIGLIVAMIAYAFIGGGVLNLVIGCAGVIIFAGLTAYDMQRLKQLGATQIGDEATVQKVAVIGALSLYLDFINLIFMLLRIFGQQR